MSLPHRFTFLTLFLLAPTLGVACSDAVADAAVSGDAEAGKPACNALVNLGTDVPILTEAAVPPPAMGGAIADGTYVVTSATLYTGPNGASGPSGKSVRMTVAIAGMRGDSVLDDMNRSATFVIAGTKLKSTATCPGTGTDEVDYSATPESLTLYLIDSKGTRVYFLGRR